MTRPTLQWSMEQQQSTVQGRVQVCKQHTPGSSYITQNIKDQEKILPGPFGIPVFVISKMHGT